MFSDDLCDLVLECMRYDQDVRPNCADLLRRIRTLRDYHDAGLRTAPAGSEEWDDAPSLDEYLPASRWPLGELLARWSRCRTDKECRARLRSFQTSTNSMRFWKFLICLSWRSRSRSRSRHRNVRCVVHRWLSFEICLLSIPAADGRRLWLRNLSSQRRSARRRH